MKKILLIISIFGICFTLSGHRLKFMAEEGERAGKEIVLGNYVLPIVEFTVHSWLEYADPNGENDVGGACIAGIIVITDAYKLQEENDDTLLFNAGYLAVLDAELKVKYIVTRWGHEWNKTMGWTINPGGWDYGLDIKVSYVKPYLKQADIIIMAAQYGQGLEQGTYRNCFGNALIMDIGSLSSDHRDVELKTAINPSTVAIEIIATDPILKVLHEAKKNRDKALAAKETAAVGFYSYDSAAVTLKTKTIEEYYIRLQELSEKENPPAKDLDEADRWLSAIKNLTEQVIFLTVNSETLEVRALWHRPDATAISESDLGGVRSFVEKVKALGFNTIYVETFWNGYASYRSDILDTHPRVASFYYGEEYQDDYIAALIGEAKKVGIDVFAWGHTFNAGNSIYKAAAVNEKWLVEDYQGNTLHPNVYGGSYYLDPANPEVLSFVESIYVEMAQKYDFAGIQFDYIRYYDNNYAATPIRDSGYGEYPEKKFKEAYQLEGDVRTLILDPQIRKKWNEWRQNNITDAVKRFAAAIRAVKKDMVISADIVANIDVARNTYMQDWPTWVNQGYIDLLCPMIYSGNTGYVAQSARQVKAELSNLSFLAVGIAPIYYGYSTLTNLEQITAVSATGGASHFASQNVIGNAAVESSLQEGIYRLPATSPLVKTADVFSGAMAAISDYYDLYCKETVNYQVLRLKIDEITAMKCENPADYQLIMEKLAHLSVITGYIDNLTVRAKVKAKIERLVAVLDIKISRELIAWGYYHPVTSARPDPLQFTYPLTPVKEDPIDQDPGNQRPEKKKGCFSFEAFALLGWAGYLYYCRKRTIFL
ncbi:MAG: family 10 glycosylhydrolase [Bacilli bacterium]|nr:family 10 glycosylhydrolase [Bacilli bacterium]